MDSNKLKLYVETVVREEIDKILEETPAPKKFYHSSNSEFEIGKTYKARRGKGSNFGAWFENLVEKQRPKNNFSRKESFFLVARPGDIDLAGGEGSYTYTVATPKYSRHHFGWLGRALDLVDGMTNKVLRENKKQLEQFIMNYWDGKPWKFDRNRDSGSAGWEYLAPKIKILKAK